MSILGTWDVRIRTPVGSIQVVYTFVDAGDGRIEGTAVARQDTTTVERVEIADGRVRWRQQITRPLRLDLEFDVVVDGDGLCGYSRAGRLPRSTVSGTRRRDPAP